MSANIVHWTRLFYILGIISISFSAIFIKWSEAEVSVIGMYRLLLTNLLLLPFLWRYRTEMARLTFRQWSLLAVSGVMLGLHFLFWMGSLRFTTVASSTVILTLQPIFVMIGSYYFLQVRGNKAMLIGMGIAIAGSIATGSSDFRLSGSALWGDFLSLLSVVAVAGHMLMGKALRETISAYVYNFLVFLFAAGSLTIYNLAHGYPFGGYSPREWGLFFLLALIPTLFGHFLFNWLLRYISASAVSMAILGEPIVASILAWQLFGETLTWSQALAGLLILIGVWVFMRFGSESSKRKRPSGDRSRLKDIGVS